jgi:hypothetical protein
MTPEKTALEVTPAAQMSPVSIIRDALANGASPEALRELLAVRREWEADEARKAFHLAMAEFQRRAPIIEKGDKAHNKQYARMDRIWRAVRPITSDLGLSVTWQKCELREGGICHVEGTLGQAQGHFTALSMDVPIPDIITGQNKAQQLGSAFTYAQRYAFCAALGIVTGDDDDGTMAGGGFVTEAQANQIADKVDACRGLADFQEAKFWQWAQAESPAEVQSVRFNDVMAALNRRLVAPAK